MWVHDENVGQYLVCKWMVKHVCMNEYECVSKLTLSMLMWVNECLDILMYMSEYMNDFIYVSIFRCVSE